MTQIQEKQLMFAAVVCNTLSVISSKRHSSKTRQKISNSYLWRRTFENIRETDLVECQAVIISSLTIGDKGGF